MICDDINQYPKGLESNFSWEDQPQILNHDVKAGGGGGVCDDRRVRNVS